MEHSETDCMTPNNQKYTFQEEEILVGKRVMKDGHVKEGVGYWLSFKL